MIGYTEPKELEMKFPKINFEPPVDHFDGGCFKDGDNTYLAFWLYDGKPSPGIVAHECKHLVNKVFIHVHHELDRYNDEAECYLLGWLVNRVWEFLEKNFKDSV